MLKTINIVGMLCAAWFIIITLNAVIFMLCEAAAAVVYLISLVGFIMWLILKTVLVIVNKERN